MTAHRDHGVSVEAALAAAVPASGGVEILECNAECVVLRLTFGTPKLSSTGKAYVAGYGQAVQGAMKFTATALIPIPRDERPSATKEGWSAKR